MQEWTYSARLASISHVMRQIPRGAAVPANVAGRRRARTGRECAKNDERMQYCGRVSDERVGVSRTRRKLTQALVRRGARCSSCVCAVSSTVCCTSLRLCSEIERTLVLNWVLAPVTRCCWEEEGRGRDAGTPARVRRRTRDRCLSLTHSHHDVFLTTIARCTPCNACCTRRVLSLATHTVHMLLDYYHDVRSSLALSPTLVDSARAHRPSSRTSLASSWTFITASTARCTWTPALEAYAKQIKVQSAIKFNARGHISRSLFCKSLAPQFHGRCQFKSGPLKDAIAVEWKRRRW